MSLSEEVVKDVGNSNPIPNNYWESNIKQAVKELKRKINLLIPKKSYCHSNKNILNLCDEIFGEKLI